MIRFINVWMFACGSLLLACLSSSSFAGETVSYTVEMNSPTVGLVDLHAVFPKLRVQPLFSEQERLILDRMNRPMMSATQMIGPVKIEDALGFEESFKKKFPTLRLEKNAALTFTSVAPPLGDPLAKEQWALKNIGQEVRVDLDDLRTAALKTISGEDLQLPVASELLNLKPIVVAVLDTGIDITHPDLKGMLRSKKEECEALTIYLDCLLKEGSTAESEVKCITKVGNIDRDGNGYPMDCAGWSVTSSLSLNEKSPLRRVFGTPDMDDSLGHGTHVAGIVGAQSGNGIGVSGVSSNVRILPVRVIDTPPTSPVRPQSKDLPNPSEESLGLGKSSVELIARGMLYAISENVQIINMSLGWPATINSRVIADMIGLAKERGIAVVAAAGNDSTDSLILPCSFSGVICVGSYGPDGKRAAYSNRGPGVDLLAPGTSILSTYPLSLRARFYTDLQGYEFMSGTSMSAPMVSGALAILLGKGFSLDEALARLMTGARVDGAALGENLRLDIRRSLSVNPRPFVRIEERAPVRLRWESRNQILRGEFHAKNLWKDMSSCTGHYRLSAALDTVTDKTLSDTLEADTSEFNCSGWKSGEEKSPSFALKVKGLRASRDFILNADLRYTSLSGEKFYQTIQVAVEIAPTPELISSILNSDVTTIDGSPAGRGTIIRTLIQADAKSDIHRPEYVVLSRLEDGISFQILSTRESKNYAYSASQKLTDLTWEFLVGQRFYSAEAKATRIALVFRKKSELSLLTQMRFEIYDEKLQTKIRTVDYDGSYAPLPENFRWTSLKEKDAILFIANGKEPPSTDVWHQVPDLTIVLRCYVLDAAGVLSQIRVNPNDPEIRIVDLLPYRSEDTEKNENALLVIRGKDFHLNYFIGHLREGVVSALQPFKILPYRNMGFLTRSPLISGAGPVSGNALSSNVGRGHMRTTVLLRDSYDTISNGDFRFSAVNPLDGVDRVVGAFQLEGKNSFFTQTNWDLQFHEFSSQGENVVKTSMNRFSFLPITVSQRAFFPILIKNETNVDEPAVLAADIGSGFFNLTALLPERDERGKVVGLLRPALLSFEGNESGCNFIQNPVWDAQEFVYRMNSFCGDSIHSVRLQIPRSN